jgi:two-component system NtrC family sensor kinase
VVEAVTGSVAETKHRSIGLGEGLTGRAAVERSQIYIPDVRLLEAGQYLPYLEGTRSELAEPLIVHDELIGVFNLEDKGVDAFDDHQRSLFSLIVREAAIAIQQKIRLIEEQERAIAKGKWDTLGRATTNLAHRVSNIAGVIPVCVQRIEERVDATDTVAVDNLGMIRDQIRYLEDLSERILKPFEPSEVKSLDVNSLLKEALAATRPQLEQHNIRPQFQQTAAPRVRIRKLLSEVFVELIVNAVKAMPQGGTLTIKTSVSDDKKLIQVSFQDTGCGIPPDKQDGIFELFQRTSTATDNSQYDPNRGFGFGLWWIRTFLQLFNGSVDLTQSVEGVGSTFVVSIPAEG